MRESCMGEHMKMKIECYVQFATIFMNLDAFWRYGFITVLEQITGHCTSRKCLKKCVDI